MQEETRRPRKFFNFARARASEFLFGGGMAVGRSLALLLLGSGIYFIVLWASGKPNPSGETMTELLIWFSYVLVPAIIIYVLIFCWYYWRAPYELMGARLNKVEGKIDQILQVAIDIQKDHEDRMNKFTENFEEESSKIDQRIDARKDEILQEAGKEFSAASDKLSKAESTFQLYVHDRRTELTQKEIELEKLIQRISEVERIRPDRFEVTIQPLIEDIEEINRKIRLIDPNI